MYEIMKEEMAGKIIEQLKILVLTEEFEKSWRHTERRQWNMAKKAVMQGLNEYWHDKIAIVWNIEDVQEYAKENYNVDIEDEPAREILNDVFDNMESEYGVTWQTIDCNISDYLERKDKGLRIGTTFFAGSPIVFS